MDDGYDEEDSGRFAEARKWGADLIGDEADRMR